MPRQRADISDRSPFAGEGELRAAGRTTDWSATSLGPVERWAPALRAAIQLCLDLPVPMAVLAGRPLAAIYNERLRTAANVAGALGRPASEVFGASWSSLQDDLARVMRRGDAAPCELASPDGLRLASTLSPLRVDDGTVVGAVLVVTSTPTDAVFRGIFDRINDAVLLTDPEQGRIVSANAAACRLFGYTQAELLTLYRSQLFDPDHPELTRMLADRDARGHAAGEITCVRKDGTRTMCEVRSTRFTDPSGEPRAASIIHDITERRAVERRLRESEERFARIHDQAPFAIALATTEGRFASVNDAFLRLFACTRDEVLGRTASEIGLNRPAQQAELLATVRERGQVRGLHVARTTRRGDELLLSVDVVPVRIAGEDHLLMTGVDVTERERAFQALRASEARLQLFIDHAPAALAMFDREMRYVAASRRWLADYKLEGDVVGRAHYDVFPEIPDRWKEVHRRSLAGETVTSDGERFERADGSVQWVKWTSVPWYTPSGDVGGILLASEDITDAKQAEAALKVADQHKDQFLATLAHELRNPLAPIRAGVDLLRSTPDPAVQQRALGAMDRQLTYLVRLVDDLLDVSRIARGKLELRRERIPLAQVIDGAIEINRPFIERGHHVLDVHLPGEPVWLHADHVRLAQAIGNLLHNAAKYSPHPGRIELRASTEDHEVVIRVRDQGLGIAPQDLASVFDLFSQVSGARGQAQGGIGIGLALSRELVELHGGTVTAESAGNGRGSTFTVRLPVVLDPHATSTPLADVDQAQRTTRRRILVVDDNVDAADMLAAMLELAGHETRVAHDGAGAIAAASELRPDIVFLDIGLPDMTGYEVARRLRERTERRRPALVALTGWGGDADRRRSAEAGFDVHLTKPVDGATVEATMARLV